MMIIRLESWKVVLQLDEESMIQQLSTPSTHLYLSA